MEKSIFKMVAIMLIIALALVGCGTQQVAAPTEKKALDPEAYFKGKTIKLVVGYSAGGGYDNNARLLAPYLQKYIPGNPNVLVENMDGAASVVATNYMYSKAKPDGLTIATIDRGVNIGISNLVKAPGLEADVRKFKHIGSLSAASHILLVNSKLPYKTLDEIKAAGKQITMGGTGPASVPATIARMYRDYFGIDIKVVAGYPGSKEAVLALTTGELDSFSINQEMAITKINSGEARGIVQLGAKYLPDAPMAQDLAPTPIAKSLAQIMSDTQITAYPFILPPDTPDDIVKVLREAFMKAATDPELTAKAKSLNLIPNPISGEELAQKVNATFNQTPEVIEALKKISTAGN